MTTTAVTAPASVDRRGPHEISSVGAVETRSSPPCIIRWRRCLNDVSAEIEKVDADIADLDRKPAPGPVAQAVKDQMLGFLRGERADLEAQQKNYENRIGTLRGDLVDVDRLLGVTSEKAPNGASGK